MTIPRRTDGCNLCGCTDAVLVADTLRNDIRRDVVRCTGCGLVCLHPLFSPDEERRLYEEEYRDIKDVRGHYLPRDARGFFEAELASNEARFRRVERFLNPRGSMLEIGSAAGSFLYHVRGRVADVRGIELHRDYSAFAREELQLQVYDRPIEELEIPDGAFDIVCVWHTLEHVRDPVGFLRHVRRVLKPGGRVFVELPNVDDALVALYRLRAYRAFYFQAPHSYYFSPRTLARAFEAAALDPHVGMIQRYGVGNHLNWIVRGRPQPKPMFRLAGPFAAVDAAYGALLRRSGRADTLFASGTKREQAAA